MTTLRHIIKLCFIGAAVMVTYMAVTQFTAHPHKPSPREAADKFKREARATGVPRP